MHNITDEIVELFGLQLRSIARTEKNESLNNYEAFLLRMRSIKINDRNLPSIVVIPNRYFDIYVAQFLAGNGYHHENLEALFKEYANPEIQTGRGGYVRNMYKDGFCPRIFWDAVHMEYQKQVAEKQEPDLTISF